MPRPNFQECWLSNDQFRFWLEKVPGDPLKAYCQVCHKQLSAEITSLKRHRFTRQHCTLEERRRAALNDHLPPNDTDDGDGDQDGGLGNAVAYATVLFIVFLAEHNLPFR